MLLLGVRVPSCVLGWSMHCYEPSYGTSHLLFAFLFLDCGSRLVGDQGRSDLLAQRPADYSGGLEIRALSRSRRRPAAPKDREGAVI